MSCPVFLVVGAKGGVGATTLSVDLAKAAVKMKKTTTIVDADFHGHRSVAELTDTTSDLNANRTPGIYSIAENNGIRVIEMLDKYDNVYALKRSELENPASTLDEGDAFTLIDAGRPFEDAVRPFVQRAGRVILVVEPNILGIKSGKTMIGNLVRFGVPANRMWIIINLRSGRSEITSREVEQAFGGIQVIAEIPKRDERTYPKAIEVLAKKLIDSVPEAPFSTIAGSMFNNNTPTSNGINLYGRSDGTTIEAIADEERIRQIEEKTKIERRTKIKNEIAEEVSVRTDMVAASRATDGEKLTRLRETIGRTIDEVIQDRTDITIEDRAELKQEIIDESLGLGPLEELMRDPLVSEIMVNGPKMIYVERAGNLTLSTRTFKDERQLRNVIERIVAPLGRRIDEASPMVDARLQDGSRVNAIIEPLALDGSSVTIRRFSKRRLGIQDLVNYKSIPEEAVGLLKAMVEGKLNIVVSGGTGSGKTTFLNILSNFIPDEDRIVTIEDAAELSLVQNHVVRLETRPPNIEGKGAITIRDLVKNSLRMRPDRIVIGECRGGEALDMLQAMNTGHDGSLTTLHANTPRDSIARLETLVLMAGFDLPIRAIREQIANAVDAVVQIQRLRDGSRKCVSITEIVGMEGDVVTMQELIRYNQEGLDEAGKVKGRFVYTGVQPHHATRFEEAGVHFDVRLLSRLASENSVW